MDMQFSAWLYRSSVLDADTRCFTVGSWSNVYDVVKWVKCERGATRGETSTGRRPAWLLRVAAGIWNEGSQHTEKET
jgi:hypothetical protein